MSTPQRRTSPGLIDRLLAAPQAFDFVQAVTILLRWLEEQGVPQERALRDHLRFANSLRLGFPASEIEDLRVDGAQDAQDADATPPRFLLTPGFMGLLGVHGALPLHYTERIGLWQSVHADAAPRAFLDILSGRMLALYYEAWRKHRVEHAAAHTPDRFMPRLLDIAGLTSSPDLPGATIAHFAGMLQQRPRSAAVLRALLASHFDVPVVLQEAVGHWSRVTPQEQSALGAGACLGENTLLGERSWRPDLRVRLQIGPLSRTRFERFLPSGDMAAALRRILAVLAPPGIDFEVRLVLQAQDVLPSRLASGSKAPPRLGRDSFVVTGAVCEDRADMRYLIRTMAPLDAACTRPRLT
jgi:type VI secretion system protein ImpH